FSILISACQQGTEVPDQTQSDPAASNNIRQYLLRVAGEISDNAVTDIQSLEEWNKVRPEKHEQFKEMISLVDVPLKGERPPLNVQMVETIQQDGFRIEKLYYESLPDLYVPADLYIPDNITEPTAGILYVCGHSRTQKVRYQGHPRRFAQLGFVCLIIETIQWNEVKGEHWGAYARGWFNWYSRGYNPGGVEAWNGIRGLDLLCERPEVNPEKLGVTGLSGGGSQSWYIGAIDPRIKAVSPVCGASTLKAQITTRTIDGHCDCMMPINTHLWDFHNLGALIAPRPLLIAQADRDGLNQIESVRKIYTDLQQVYTVHGVPENVRLIESPGGHSYHQISRQEIFSFFIKHLMGKDVPPEETGDIDESPEAMLSVADLSIYKGSPPKDDRTTIIQDQFIKLPEPPFISDDHQLIAYRDKVKDFLLDKTFKAFPTDPPPFNPELIFRDKELIHGRTTIAINTEQDWRLKVNFRWNNDPDEKNPMMIFMHSPRHERRELSELYWDMESNWNVAFFETRGVGEFGWSDELQWHVRRASAWTGRTVASMQVYDLLRCIEYCRTLDGVDPDKIGIFATEEMSVVAMYAALLDGNCHTVMLRNATDTQNKGGQTDGRDEAIEMLNCLRITDVNQIPALISPANVVFLGEVPETYQWAKETLERVGKGSSFRVIDNISEF
ncbi:hypothetical protein ACFLU5_11480, partial [Bacteroidota bacterium]